MNVVPKRYIYENMNLCRKRVFAEVIEAGILRGNHLGLRVKLAQVLLEAKSHNLPSAMWRPRRVGGVTQPTSEALRTRELMVSVQV